MRLREIQISRYGPLPELPRTSLGDFVLFFGENEHGKTLLIDALIKLLFKKHLKRGISRKFGNLDRVSEEPDGFVVLEVAGKEVKLEKGQSIIDLVPSLAPEDFRNVFIVRNSDLSMDSEQKYYANVTEKLAGLRTSEILRIIEKLKQKGRLKSARPDSALTDKAEAGHIARRVTRARELSGRISELTEKLGSKRFDVLERELLEVQERLAALEKERDLLKEAEIRKRFKEAKKRLDKLRVVLGELDRLAKYNEDDLERWRSSDQEKRRLEAEIEEAKEKFERKEELLRTAREESVSLGKKFAFLDLINKRVEEDLGPRARAWSDRRTKLTERFSKGRVFLWWFSASLVFLALSMVGAISRQSTFFVVLTTLFLAAALFLGMKVLALRVARGELDATLGKLLRDAMGAHLETGSFEELVRSMASKKKELEVLRWELHEREKEKGILESALKDLGTHISQCQEEVQQSEDTIASIKLRTGAKTLDAYGEKLEEKKAKLIEEEGLRGALESVLGRRDTLQESLAFWEEEISSRLGGEEESLPFDSERLGMIEREMEDLQSLREQRSDALEEGKEKLARIGWEVKDAGILPDEPALCRTTVELQALGERLGDFVQAVERDKALAQEGIRIFQEIEVEEKERIGDLFGTDKAVSRYFQNITDGFYSEVVFDLEKTRISVGSGSGKEMSVDCLSGGAFDQLYLAIRLSIGERFLTGEKGFFIMDDPFVKADEKRLSRQLEILRRMASSGWQILYFSAKREVLEKLGEPSETKPAHVIELKEPVVRPWRRGRS